MELINYNQKLMEKGFLTDLDSIDFVGFIEYCELEYKMSSKEFLIWYESAGFEGNSDMKLWYIMAKDTKSEQSRKD